MKTSVHGKVLSGVTLAFFLSAGAAAAQQVILGNQFQMKWDGEPNTTQIKARARELDSPNTLSGDPQANGASVTIIANGGTSGTQTFTLPSGEAWRRSPRDPLLPAMGWTYSDTHGLNSAVKKLVLKARPGKFKIDISVTDRYGDSLTLVPPNPATYMGALVAIDGPGGDTYCMNFGGAAGGLFARNTATAVKITRPTSESVCPTTTPSCGDGFIQAPIEVCDVGNDAACPGQCGANGLPCLCPVCGDGVVDAGESCDGSALGSCTEGCTYQCTCTTCGNNLTELPGEECDGTDDLDCPGLCLLPAGPNQCRCPVCGDNQVNHPSELCDGDDDSACPGGCVVEDCVCAICGNGLLEPSEECDPGGPGGVPGADDGDCEDACSPTCSCP